MATALLASWEGLQMRRPNRLTTPLALCAAAALLLTGCTGGGGEESPSPTTSQSSSSSPSGTESAGGGSDSESPTESATPEPATSTSPAKNIPAPEMPEAMKNNDQAGLEAALEYWFVAAHHLKITGDPTPLQSVSLVSCDYCSHLADNWPQVYEDGGWAVNDLPKVDIGVSNIDDGGHGTYLFDLTEYPTSVHLPDGTLHEGASADETITTPWSGSASYSDESKQWHVESLSVQDAG